MDPFDKKKKDCYCSVYGCGSRRLKDPALSFHTFPRKGSFVYVRDEHGVESQMDRKKVWEMILLMRTSAHHHRVCSLHFSENDYYLPGYSTRRCKLRDHAIPTLNLPQTRRNEPPKFPCMVQGCSSDGKIFLLWAPKPKDPPSAKQKWNLWLQAMGLVNAPMGLSICDAHFVSGKPSNLVNDPDYVPSLNIVNQPTKFEEINLNEQHTSTLNETITNRDPLGMDYEFAPYSFKEESPYHGEELLEDLIKIEPVDFDVKIEVENYLPQDHSYCK